MGFNTYGAEDGGSDEPEVVVDGEIWEVKTIEPERGYSCEVEGCNLPDGGERIATVEVELVRGVNSDDSGWSCYCSAHFEKWSGVTLESLGLGL
jgi:hypothetical protein